MPGSSTRSLERLVAGFWLLNLIIGVGIMAAWLLLSNNPVRAFFISPTPTPVTQATPSPEPSSTLTSTLFPTETASLSITPTETSTSTPTPTETPTPVPFSEGPVILGYSVQLRPMEVYRFGSGPIERLIVAGMHGGGEYNTVKLADELIAYIQAHPETIPVNVTLYILRDLNPDGVARAIGSLGRANAHGVDLNRNWDANWQKDWPRDNCWVQTYVTGGTGPMSEPETKVLAAFILNHHFDALINYHSAALGIFAGGLHPDDPSIRLAKAVAAVTTYPYPPVNIGCKYTGGFTDWADGKGIAALDVELTDHTHTDFEMNLKVLTVLLSWKR
jgi:predicted deacylase